MYRPVSYTHLDVYKRQDFNQDVGGQIVFFRFFFNGLGQSQRIHGMDEDGFINNIFYLVPLQMANEMQMCIRDSS